MNKSQLWGFEVSHIVASFAVLATVNIFLNIIGGTLIISWVAGIVTLITLRVVSHGQKDGHLELLGRFIFEPHIFLGHKKRSSTLNGEQNEKIQFNQ